MMINDLPLISVIMPVYEGELYLEKAFDSVLNQTYKNIELLAVYTKSADASYKICEKYASIDNRVKIIINDSDRIGAGLARNYGLDAAAGEYIAFIDSDDEMSKDYIEVLYNNAISHNADISICSQTRRENDFDAASKRIIILTREEALSRLLEGELFNQAVWTKLFKRDVVEKFPEYRVAEDLYFVWNAMSRASVIVCSLQKLYYYRKNTSSISWRYRDGDLNCKLSVLSSFRDGIPSTDCGLDKRIHNRASIIGMQSYFQMRMCGASSKDEEKTLEALRKDRFITGAGNYSRKVTFMVLLYERFPKLAFALYKLYHRLS